MTRAMPLYLMIKPPPFQRAALVRCANTFGIDSSYSSEKYHSTILKLGESQAWSSELLDRFCQWMDLFEAEPFPVNFEVLDGYLLRERKVGSAAAFQRELARFAARLGFGLPEHRFWLHLSLAYGMPPNRRVAIEPINWLVEEVLLIRSIHGVGHEEIARWPLRRRQFELPFSKDHGGRPGTARRS